MTFPSENATEIETTVKLFAIVKRRIGPGLYITEQKKITELDCKLDLAYWDNGEDASERYGYELRGVTTDAGYISLKTDAAWFKLICEGLEHDHAAIMDKLREVDPGISAPKLEAAE